MARQNKLRYADFADRIDVDALYTEIGWEPIDTDARGNDYGYCLWPENHSHGDTTGKFAIHREEMVYNCYVCGGGSLLSLAMELHDLDVDDATKWLYQFAGGDARSDQEFTEQFLAYFADAEKRANTLPFFNERVLDRFDPVPDWYLDARGISRIVADAYGVRFSADATRRPPPKGLYAEDPEHVGPLIVFPQYWNDRLVGWQNRWVTSGDKWLPKEFGDVSLPKWLGKYTNTTGFPKEYTVYGWELALGSSEPVIVVESVPTVLFLMSLGYVAVATFGSDINEPQMRLLRRFSNGVILGPDNDSAGVKWQRANTEYLKRYIPVWHLPPVKGKPGADVGDFASSHNPHAKLEEHLAKAKLPELNF
jgi:DNA primase